MHILDNEASEEFKREIQKHCTIQLVPLDNHRQNLAEQAIQTFKNHFKAILAGVDDTFPMRLWDRLLPQTILTLNLLRQSNAVPTILAQRICPRQLWLQQNAISPNGMCGAITPKQWETSNMGSKLDRWMVLTNIPGALPMPCSLCETNEKWESVRHSIFQNKVHHATYHNPGGYNYQSTQQLKTSIKGKKQCKRIRTTQGTQKLEDILNNTPETAPIPIESPPLDTRRVTFKQTAKPSQGETEPEDAAPSARVNEPIQQTRTATPIHTATIDKPIANTLTPRVQKIPASKNNNPARMEMRDRIRKHLQAKTMARITQRNTYLCWTTQNSKRAQLIHDMETNTYLNYRQLLRHPKYKDSWAKSAANEFGRLTQGLKDSRVKGIDAIKFIRNE